MKYILRIIESSTSICYKLRNVGKHLFVELRK